MSKPFGKVEPRRLAAVKGVRLTALGIVAAAGHSAGGSEPRCGSTDWD